MSYQPNTKPDTVAGYRGSSGSGGGGCYTVTIYSKEIFDSLLEQRVDDWHYAECRLAAQGSGASHEGLKRLKV